MNAGRKPLKHPEIIDAEAMLDQPRIENAMIVMREVAVSEEKTVRADIFRLGQMVGARQMNLLAAKFLRAADISLFDEISESKVYKHLDIKFPDGNLRPADNIQEFCKVFFNVSYSVMAESRKALEVLGSESYEIAKSLNLKRSQLRLLINLPEDARAAVAEAMQSGSKPEVDTLILSLANQLDETKARALELEGEVKAKEKVLEIRAKQIDVLQENAERVKTLPPDEVLNELHQEATKWFRDTRGALIGRFRQAVNAIDQHNQEHGGSSDAFLAGLCGQLQHELTIIRDEFNIKDITKVLDAPPEWMTDPRFNDFDPNNAAPPKH